MHWIFAVVSLVAALSASAPARSQGVAVNPSAAASDVRNPSSFNPAAAASDIRNPSATNPAAAASDLRQPGLTSPGAPSAIRRPTAPRLVGPPAAAQGANAARDSHGHESGQAGEGAAAQGCTFGASEPCGAESFRDHGQRLPGLLNGSYCWRATHPAPFREVNRFGPTLVRTCGSRRKREIRRAVFPGQLGGDEAGA